MKHIQRHTAGVYATLLFSLLFVCIALVPAVSSAQQDDLNATVRSAILSDPRSASMTSAEIDAMVEILSGQAQEQGVTAQDITWRPAEPVVETSDTSACGSLPAFFCQLNWAFGFDGSDLKIPIGLGVSSGWLLFVLGMMLEKELLRRRALAARPAQTSPVFGSSI